MYDPLSAGFNTESNPGWPSVPHTASAVHAPPLNIAPEADAWQSASTSTFSTATASMEASISTGVTSPSISTINANPLDGPHPGPFGREPKVYGAPEPGLISPVANKTSNGVSLEKNDPYLRVRIIGLDRNRRDILIRFDAQTNLPNFTGQTYRNISRSYFEFQQFAEQIIWSNPQTIIPALPLAQTSAANDDEDDRLVKIMLQRWLSRICEDPILLQDEELRLFIESDFGYQPTVRPRRKAGTGFSLIKRGVPDEDEVLQRARFELTKLEGQYFDAAKAVDKLARSRRVLAQAHVEMGNKLINVSTGEGQPALAAALKKFGRTCHSLSDLGQAQAMSECVMLGDSLGYQGLNAKSGKETLMSRTAVLEEHQAAVKATIAKRRQIERLKASSNIRPDRVDEALEELEEASKYENLLARRVDGISQNLHRALHRHSRLSQEDVTMVLVEHARTTIMYEKQLLRELEALRPDFLNAAKKAPLPAPVKIIPPVRPLTPPNGPARLISQTQSAIVQQHQGRPWTPGPPTAPYQQQQQQPYYPQQSQQPAPIQPVSAAQGPLGQSSPGAGPSTPGRFPAQRFPHANHLEGTKSMFITPNRTSTVSSPVSPSPAPPVRDDGARVDPLTGMPIGPSKLSIRTAQSSAAASGSGPASEVSDPLLSPPIQGQPSPQPGYTQAQGYSYTSQSQTFGRAGMNGKGPLSPQGGGHPLAQSMHVGPRRLDAREAAAKLANFL
ncbi:hypothetical protein M422DRAFT_238559 [Sphaerobolus stellatus SS14]|nr:hypothetical protein M422DRAFT_238559 [Sphaerobolus stellatus SS14]